MVLNVGVSISADAGSLSTDIDAFNKYDKACSGIALEHNEVFGAELRRFTGSGMSSQSVSAVACRVCGALLP